MAGPFTYPVAQSIPFEPNRNPGYGGVPSDIESQNVQDAIEEAKHDALNNDRYLIFCAYNGNANAGRYLEMFPSIDMSTAPYYSAVDTTCLTIVAATVAANSTCTIGFYSVDGTETLLYTLTFSNEKRKIVSGTPIFTLLAARQLYIRVDSGSISKPHLYFSLSAST